ncbi:MAG: exonuclease SbcCD subunit D C-terminal domain-containing protein [Aquisalimonadaceae bacterium]
MRFLHTSDWHLGQTLHGQERQYEHQCFLDWLLIELDQRRPDALLIAGDIFDTVNPPVKAQELLYGFIVRAHAQDPRLQIVMIAGNHDSGARIELPSPLMRNLRAHALGRVRWLDDGGLDSDHLLVPLENRSGETVAWCIALPFLRPAEVTAGAGEADYVAGIARVHEQLINAALERREPDQALIAMSHAHLAGAQISADSERPIVMGGLEELPASLFPKSIAYVALGHLHKPQRVGRQNRIRYSGSPLPLSFAEVNYRHQLIDVTLERQRLTAWKSVPIPRRVRMLRIPADGPAPLDAVLPQLEGLDYPGTPDVDSPWLEVRILLDTARPELRHQVEQALAGKAVRLVRLSVSYPESSSGGEPVEQLISLDQLDPRDLFSRIWEDKYGQHPPDQVMRDFAQLLDEVANQSGDAGA